jgi:hypothetical protein
MRKALLVLALVSASFAGGAFINGPGLAWLRTSLGLPMLEVEAPREESAKPAAPSPQSFDPAPPAALRRPASSADATKPAVAPKAEAVAERDSVAPGFADYAPPRLEPPASTSERSAPVPKRDRDVVRSVAEKSEQPEAKAKPVQQPPSANTATAWADALRRMKALGVSRYWVEGAPGDAVRLRCVVPLVGRDAVAQMFEATSDDLLSAADTVLRHITLWKAAGGDK